MNKITEYLDRFLSNLVVLLMAILVIDVVWQVTTRYLLGEASSYTEEIARYLLIWIGLLGSAFAYREKMHLAFDLLVNKATPAKRFWMGIIIHTLIGLFSLIVLVLGGTYLVNMTYELDQYSTALQVRLAYVYLALPLSGVIIMYYASVFIKEIVSGEAELLEPQSDEAA